MIIGSTYEYICNYKTKKNGKDNYAIEIKYKENKGDIENNNSEKKNSYEHKSKTNVYEVNKKENIQEEKKTEKSIENDVGNSAKNNERHGMFSKLKLFFGRLKIELNVSRYFS